MYLHSWALGCVSQPSGAHRSARGRGCAHVRRGATWAVTASRPYRQSLAVAAALAEVGACVAVLWESFAAWCWRRPRVRDWGRQCPGALLCLRGCAPMLGMEDVGLAAHRSQREGTPFPPGPVAAALLLVPLVCFPDVWPCGLGTCAPVLASPSLSPSPLE